MDSLGSESSAVHDHYDTDEATQNQDDPPHHVNNTNQTDNYLSSTPCGTDQIPVDHGGDGDVNFPSMPKGFGLKKWKRIIRTGPSVTHSPALADDAATKVFKRDFSDSEYPISPPAELSRKSDDSTGSANVLGHTFATEGTDSENSEEDHSSKSSTAATASKMKTYSTPMMRLDNVSAASNSKPSGRRSTNYNGGNSDEAPASELLADDVAQDLSWERKDEKGESDQQTDGCDPLVESMRNFLSIYKTLEKEIQKFGEIGKESLLQNLASISDDNLHEGSTVTKPELHRPSHLQSEKIRQNASSSLEMQVLSLREYVKCYENKLEETMAILEIKSSRVTELEAILNTQDHEVGNDLYLHKGCRELENNLENIFQQKIEAEIKHLVLSRTLLNLNLRLLEKQKAVAEEQTETLNNLGDTAIKARTVKKKVENMEKHCDSIIESEEILEIQRRVYKATSRFFMQFVLLLLVFWLFVDHLSPHSGLVIPT
ncbi:hypothetical protein ACFE04_025009 [Oxalis oulophora]